MNYPKTRFVFDRKKTATKTKSALIQIEISHENRRKYISTGVKVFSHQWSDKLSKVMNSPEMESLNRTITTIKSDVDNTIALIIEQKGEFSFNLYESFTEIKNEGKMTFAEFIKSRVEERTDLRATTKRSHLKNVSALEKFGRIQYFRDLTKENILAFDKFLRDRGLKQNTIHTYHKVNKTYINDAIYRGIISESPYTQFKSSRGETGIDRWLSEEEFKRIKEVELPTDSLSHVRDLFVLQCFTGLAYSDLMSCDFSKATQQDGVYYLSGDRVKTGVSYCAVLLPEAMEIVRKYNHQLPKLSNQKYNLYLKAVVQYAGINKPITSHWGRHTCGMLLLNRGVSIEVVARILGHSSIRMTESVYAKILDQSAVIEVVNKVLK